MGLLILGLNPSQQTIARLQSLALGQVNRAEAALPGVGGKGQNAAKAAATLLAATRAASLPCGVALAQFLGGDAGDIVQRHLERFGIRQLTGPVSAATRQTLTLLDYPAAAEGRGPEVTELVMPSAKLERSDVEALLERVVSEAPRHKAILLMGTWPQGVDASFYSAVAKAKAPGALVWLDACKPVEEVAAILAEGDIDIYKVNAVELCTLMGATDFKEGEASAGQVAEAASRALERFQGLRALAITDGPGVAYMFSRDDVSLRFDLPKVQCLNPIGAGDTVAGVMAAAYCSSTASAPSLADAFRLGLSAASAKVQSEGEGGVFEVTEMDRVNRLIDVTEV